MGFIWVENITAAAKLNNSNMAEIVNNISTLETLMAIPAGSQFKFPAGEEPFAQTGAITKASSMKNIRDAVYAIDTYQAGATCKAYCTTVNTTFKTHYVHYTTNDASLKSHNITIYATHYVHNATAHKTVNSGHGYY